jgi:hypothetical protein
VSTPAKVPTKKRAAKKAPKALWNGSLVFGGCRCRCRCRSRGARDDMSFVFLHRNCGGRIEQPKRCSVHKQLVKPGEIVKGFEFATGPVRRARGQGARLAVVDGDRARLVHDAR